MADAKALVRHRAMFMHMTEEQMATQPLICQLCGSVVKDTVAHQGWHESLVKYLERRT